MSSRPTAASTAHPVRLHRREHRLTQAELATAVGVSRQTVIAIERGDYAPSVHLALRLAKVLGATVEDLFAEPDPAGPDPVKSDPVQSDPAQEAAR